MEKLYHVCGYVNRMLKKWENHPPAPPRQIGYSIMEDVPMSLFSKNRVSRVKSFVLKLVNNNCPELKAALEGPRADSRVNLTVVVGVVPLVDGKPQLRQAFTAVTKEFSLNGAALVLDRPRALDEAILCFRFEGEMTYMRAKAKHLSPIGGGFYQLGFHLLEVVAPADYPKLETMAF
jgi:hypothetical protein